MGTVIVFASAKGGSGKTSLALNVAMELAQTDSTLVVDLDMQADLTSGLGIRGSDHRFDDGAALFKALTQGHPLEPVTARWVEPGGRDDAVVYDRKLLRAIPGGETMGEFLPWMVRSGDGNDDALARVLAPHRERYRYIIIDCPPMDTWTQRQALRAAKWLIVPISDDLDELRGLDRILRTSLTGHGVRLLGAAMVRMPAGARTALRDTRETAEAILDGVAPVFTTVVRESVEFGRAKELGLAVREYADWVTRTSGFSSASSARRLAHDYALLADEVIGAIVRTSRA